MSTCRQQQKQMQDIFNLRKGSPIKCVRGNNIVSLRRQVGNGVKDGVGSTRHSNTCEGMSTLQLRVARLENVRRGVHDAAVNVSQLLERKQVGSMFCILELIGSGPEENSINTDVLGDLFRDHSIAIDKTERTGTQEHLSELLVQGRM